MYNFKEAKFGPNFAKDKMTEFKTLINRGLSFVTISMPGVGASYFLKYLATRDFAYFTAKQEVYFIHVDMYSLPALTQHEFFKLLLEELGGKPAKKTDEQLLQDAKQILKDLLVKQPKIVLIFNRFDQLKSQFDENFLSRIQSLNAIDPDKIVLIFTSTKPLTEITPEALSGGNLNFYSENLYFKPYSTADLKEILEIDPGRLTTQENLDRLLKLSGGHNQLLHILLSSQKEELLLDQFVKMQLKELMDYLSYSERKQVQKIALGKKVDDIDEYLLGIGMIIPEGKLFTPLLEDYIKTNLPAKLPVKENTLFKLLKASLGEIVPKDEIFKEVWGEDDDSATDWALDALIYRLRKHPFMSSQGYIIESHKKVGYTLIQT